MAIDQITFAPISGRECRVGGWLHAVAADQASFVLGKSSDFPLFMHPSGLHMVRNIEMARLAETRTPNRHLTSEPRWRDQEE